MQFTESEFFYESHTSFPLFGCDIEVMMEKEDADFAYAKRCAQALATLSDETVATLCRCSVLYCNHFCELVGESPPLLHGERDILQHIRPGSLLVPAPQGESVVVHLSCNCDWEPEHGLEWLVRDGRVLYVGAYNGEPPFQDEGYYRKSWNYAYLTPGE